MKTMLYQYVDLIYMPYYVGWDVSLKYDMPLLPLKFVTEVQWNFAMQNKSTQHTSIK